MLIAYLRLADALHIPDRPPLKELITVLRYEDMDAASKFHWLKSMSVSDTIAIPDDNIIFKLKIPAGWKEEKDRTIAPLIDIIKIELQNELDSVKDILVEGRLKYGLPAYLTVDYNTEITYMTPDEIEDFNLLLEVLLEAKRGIKHLFSVDVAMVEQLNKGMVSEKSEKMFKTKGFPLSKNVTIRKEKDDKWVIIDEEKIYIVKQEDGKLNIYGIKKLQINPFILKSAFAEKDIDFYKSQIKTNEYEFLLDLCMKNQSREFNPYNIALIGNYGTGKSKNALNLIHEFEENGVGFYVDISGTTAGQIIVNIFREIHHHLFGSRRLIFEKSSLTRKTLAKILFVGIEVSLPEGIRIQIPREHIDHFRGVLNSQGSKKDVGKIIQDIHNNFEEAFAGIIEYHDILGGLIEEFLPEEKVTELISPEVSAYHIGEMLNAIAKPVLLVLDEVEKIHKLPRKERVKFLDFLRALLDVNNKNVFLFCFTRFSFDKLIKEYAALYHRIPYIVTITNFNRPQLEEFIANRLSAAKVESIHDFFEDSFIDLLWEITGGNQRSTLFVLDRFFEYSPNTEIEPPYTNGDLITFLELESDIKNQLLDMLLYDIKERAVSDPKMSNILNILVECYDGSPTKFSELLKSEQCIYDKEELQHILIRMMEEDIIKVSKVDNEMIFIINIDIPPVLSGKGWVKRKQEVFT